jgi:hypothetical protein
MVQMRCKCNVMGTACTCRDAQPPHSSPLRLHGTHRRPYQTLALTCRLAYPCAGHLASKRASTRWSGRLAGLPRHGDVIASFEAIVATETAAAKAAAAAAAAAAANTSTKTCCCKGCGVPIRNVLDVLDEAAQVEASMSNSQPCPPPGPWPSAKPPQPPAPPLPPPPPPQPAPQPQPAAPQHRPGDCWAVRGIAIIQRDRRSAFQCKLCKHLMNDRWAANRHYLARVGPGGCAAALLDGRTHGAQSALGLNEVVL